MQYKELDISKIKVKYNSRSTIKKDDLADLMQSIKENSLLQPVGVMKKGDKYELLFGNRRLQSFKKLGRTTIPAIITDREISEADAILMNATENIVRKKISVIELGKIALDLKEQFNMSNGEIAVALSIPPRRIKTALDIIRRAPKEIQDMIGYYNTGVSGANRQGKIPPSVINKIYSSRLTKEQAAELVEYCRKTEAVGNQISQIIELIKNGLSIKEAITTAENFRYVEARLVVDKGEYDKIKSEHKSFSRYINKIIEGELPSHPGLIVNQ